MKITIKPYKGFMSFPRAILLLFVQDGVINFNTFGAFIALLSEFDWDTRHDTYGYLTKTNEYLSEKLGCDATTILRKKRKLIELGCFEETDKGLKIKYIQWIDPKVAGELGKHEYANAQEFIAKTQEIIADMQENPAKMQSDPPRKYEQSSNVSSKGNLGFVSDNDPHKGLSQDDEDWIKENLEE